MVLYDPLAGRSEGLPWDQDGEPDHEVRRLGEACGAGGGSVWEGGCRPFQQGEETGDRLGFGYLVDERVLTAFAAHNTGPHSLAMFHAAEQRYRPLFTTLHMVRTCNGTRGCTVGLGLGGAKCCVGCWCDWRNMMRMMMTKNHLVGRRRYLVRRRLCDERSTSKIIIQV